MTRNELFHLQYELLYYVIRNEKKKINKQINVTTDLTTLISNLIK